LALSQHFKVEKNWEVVNLQEIDIVGAVQHVRNDSPPRFCRAASEMIFQCASVLVCKPDGIKFQAGSTPIPEHLTGCRCPTGDGRERAWYRQSHNVNHLESPWILSLKMVDFFYRCK